MPLGRQKSHIAVLTKLSVLPFVVRAPTCGSSPTTMILAWLVNKATFSSGANETVELWGDGATRGYKLEYLSTRQFRLTVYGGAGGSVTTTNALEAVAGTFGVVVALISSGSISISLGEVTAGAIAVATMTAIGATDDRILTADDTAGTNSLLSLAVARVAQGSGSSMANSGYAAAVRRAQRLLEPAGCFSYIDFSRYRPPRSTTSPAQGHFGDDRSPAQVEALATVPHGLVWRRADRQSDWSLT